MTGLILLRGGGDLASGVALRLLRCGYHVVITELAAPLAVRRTVSFSEAVYEGTISIENQRGCLASSFEEALAMASRGDIAVIVDPSCGILAAAEFSALVDARLLKSRSDTSIKAAPLVIGLGPGFTCGENCHAVVETQRGHHLGRVYWSGSASEDTGTPEGDPRRVLRAPIAGVLSAHTQIGEHAGDGQLIADIDGQPVYAPFAGMVRGLIRPGVQIAKNVKIGDIDPRNNRDYCFSVSDKALAVAGGVLEALLSSANPV